jgi:hypothetical protein
VPTPCVVGGGGLAAHQVVALISPKAHAVLHACWFFLQDPLPGEALVIVVEKGTSQSPRVDSVISHVWCDQLGCATTPEVLSEW